MADMEAKINSTVYVNQSSIRNLPQTQQVWHYSDNGASVIYNTPIETGKSLDAKQGKVPNYRGTCGIVSCVNVLRLAGRSSTTENEVLTAALQGKLCVANDSAGKNGGTTPDGRKKILVEFGLDSELKPASIDSIAQCVSEGRGVIISVDARKLWRSLAIPPNSLHAVTVTSVQKDRNNQIEGFYICDSGSGKNDSAKFYATKHLQDSLSNRQMNVTTTIIR